MDQEAGVTFWIDREGEMMHSHHLQIMGEDNYAGQMINTSYACNKRLTLRARGEDKKPAYPSLKCPSSSCLL